MHGIFKMVVTAALPMALGLAMAPAQAIPFSFNTGDPNGLVGTGSRPSSAAGVEIESADDFILGQRTLIDHATFYGLIPLGATVDQVRLEIYRVFPNDSSDPPSGKVPTRNNSPSDVALQERDGASGLTFSTTSLGAFTVANTVLNGINPSPNQTTFGEGPASGQQVLFDVELASAFDLLADHYFFIPQVALSTGDFLWLSAPKPITGGTGPFAPDLQSWIRDENLAPDWLRIGTDIIGNPTGGAAPTFNAAFSISGETQAVPEPPGLALLALGAIGLLGVRRRSDSRGGQAR